MAFKFYLLWLLACLLLCLHANAHAQQANCPPGTIPYSSGTDQSVCGPDDSQQQQQPRPQAPPMHWQTRWGAIATDSIHGIIGTTTEQPSKEEAEQVALTDCATKGGTQCKIEAAYGNGCAAMTVGDKIHNVYTAPTIKEATRLGLKLCRSEDKNCSVYYTACSTPFLVP